MNVAGSAEQFAHDVITFRYTLFLSNHHGVFSSYDTAPATVSKGLSLLITMSHLFNALPTADATLVSTSADAILVFAGPYSVTD